ncbi:MAG: methyltransferase type 11, partial [Tomitella sp.]|nr:methyltransferase type 11 [Tomitella sp.]
WADHPEYVAGTMQATGHFSAPLLVRSTDRWAGVQRVFDRAAKVLPPMPPRPVPAMEMDVAFTDAEGRKERSFHEIDGTVYAVTCGTLDPVVRPSRELRSLIGLRDAAVRLVDLEADTDLPDADLCPARAEAAALYARYVDRFGPLNRSTVTEGPVDPETGVPKLSVRRPSMGGFRRDPDYPLVLALENYDPDSGQAEPAAILTRRVNTRPERVDRVDTPAEALALSLSEAGRLDLGRVAALLGAADADAAAEALGDLVYQDPDRNGVWVTARTYLSGDVRAKLATAKAAAAVIDTYSRNVDALAEVQPADLTAAEVRVNLGAPWLTTDDVKAFIVEVLEPRRSYVSVEHSPTTASWDIGADYVGASEAARMAYGTDRFTPAQLLQYGLNGRRPIVYDEHYDPATATTRRVRNAAATAAAADKLQALQERFSLWVYEDRQRHDRILADYNRRFNSHVTRHPDGAYITVPGLAAGVSLWEHQKNALDLALSSPRCLIGHAVGAGKTRTFLALAVLLRHYGIANRPCIAVPKHLLEQVSREAHQLFPAGRFLIATDEDLRRDARRLFAARCATGGWDAVILTHEAFSSLQVDPATERAWIDTQISQMRDAEEAAGRTGAKQIARVIRSLKTRFDQLRDNVTDPDQLSIEQLGIDYLAVDEADKFLRLPVATRAEGFSLGSSKRAADMLLKVDTLAQRFPGRPVMSAYTGTPFRNTLAETYCWARMMVPERLDELGLSHFDAFAAVFIRWETRIEVSPEGAGFRVNTRPSTIQNLPELRRLLGEFADLLSADALGLDRPERRDHTVVLEPDEPTTEYVGTLVERSEALRGGRGRDGDNMLAVCGDGRKVALDPHLAGLRASTVKLTAVADKVADVYYGSCSADYGTGTAGALQLVLCDLGTPKPHNSSTYGRLRQQMMMRGVPADRIRFAHEGTTPKAREALHAACRDGSVSVLIGSTPKIGIGTNIQTRLAAVHMVAPPWRPSDIEQGLGRAFRPGNRNTDVGVYTYVLERTFDAFSWETLARKQKSFWHLYTADSRVREIDDVGDVQMDFDEIKAAASGNPLLLEEAEAKAGLRTLQLRYATFLQNRRSAEQRAADLADRVDLLTSRADRLDELVAALTHVPFPRPELRGVLDKVLRFGRHAYGPVRIEAHRTGYSGPVTGLRATYRGVEVAWLKVTRTQVKKGSAVIAQLFSSLLDGVGAVHDRAHELLVQARRQQADAETTAAAAVFDDEAALAAAEARLASVQAQIVDFADDSSPAAAA